MDLPSHHPRHVVRRIQAVVVIFFGLGLLTYFSAAAGVLAFGWEDTTTTRLTRVMPLPGAVVGFHLYSVHGYLVQFQALAHYQQSISTQARAATTPSVPKIRQATMRKVLRDGATLELLHDAGLQVTAGDINQAFSAQLDQTGNRAATIQAIHNLYDWSPTQYKQYVVTSAVAREKLREYLSFHGLATANTAKQAADIQATIKADPTTFADQAKRYSQDPSNVAGGDLGFVSKGEQPEEVDQVAFSLEVGSVSDVIHTKFGYHIIMVTDKRDLAGQPQVRLQEIFLAGPSVDEAITAKLKSQRVVIMLPGFHWNATTGDVDVRGA